MTHARTRTAPRARIPWGRTTTNARTLCTQYVLQISTPHRRNNLGKRHCVCVLSSGRTPFPSSRADMSYDCTFDTDAALNCPSHRDGDSAWRDKRLGVRMDQSQEVDAQLWSAVPQRGPVCVGGVTSVPASPPSVPAPSPSWSLSRLSRTSHCKKCQKVSCFFMQVPLFPFGTTYMDTTKEPACSNGTL